MQVVGSIQRFCIFNAVAIVAPQEDSRGTTNNVSNIAGLYGQISFSRHTAAVLLIKKRRQFPISVKKPTAEGQPIE